MKNLRTKTITSSAIFSGRNETGAERAVEIESVMIIDLLHDPRYLCTHVRTDGTKAMSRGFEGGKQVIKSAN